MLRKVKQVVGQLSNKRLQLDAVIMIVVIVMDVSV